MGLGILVPRRQTDRDGGLDRGRCLDELWLGARTAAHFLGCKELVGFGVGVTGFTMTDYLVKSADRLAIGYFQGAGPLGYFQNAFTIYSNVVAILTEAPHNIAASSLSKLRSDVEGLKRAWATALSTLSFFSVPAFAILAVIGQDFVVLLLGQKWAAAGPLLCIFAVRGIAYSVERTMAGFTWRSDAPTAGCAGVFTAHSFNWRLWRSDCRSA